MAEFRSKPQVTHFAPSKSKILLLWCSAAVGKLSALFRGNADIFYFLILFSFGFGNNWFGLATSSIFFFVQEFVSNTFFWVGLDGLGLEGCQKSCTLALTFFYFLWFGLQLHFLALSPISSFGLATMGLAFLSSYLYKSMYTNVHICTPPMMIRN